MLDETSPFIAAWFMAMILMTMMMKVTYSPWTSEIHLASYRHLVSNMKPCITLCTGIFSCSVHCYVHNMWREDNVFVLGCVIMLSLGLSIVEIFWSMQVNKFSGAKVTTITNVRQLVRPQNHLQPTSLIFILDFTNCKLFSLLDS